MAKQVKRQLRAHDGLLSLKTELWQSFRWMISEGFSGLLSLKTELWQSDPRFGKYEAVGLLSLKTELWQSEGGRFPPPSGRFALLEN